jgi:hypothetical protein
MTINDAPDSIDDFIAKIRDLTRIRPPRVDSLGTTTTGHKKTTGSGGSAPRMALVRTSARLHLIAVRDTFTTTSSNRRCCCG